MRIHTSKLEFQVWLHIECLVPFVLVLIVIPMSLLVQHPPTHRFIHTVDEVLAGGELPAVAFCMLLPTLIFAMQQQASQAELFFLSVGGLAAIMCYAMFKLEPVDVKEDPFATLLLLRGGASTVLMGFTVYLAIRVRAIALANRLKETNS